ncbi:hypothetical protein [Croceimicrobium hydrocarbonivorans]|uniref:Uncharacterized protein n=1 Tax=Croceimicrobium hydrocarbonivorans TaxID=2761580 RepID=A0A7H0VIQ5_9FLAO|nr:hypothetical protein [Croceimicrobium hydrocarbonivorans]QNR25603.1 hypothetical protein H4K34_07105 [Croceimicrobium hydrocarbonivorans]
MLRPIILSLALLISFSSVNAQSFKPGPRIKSPFKDYDPQFVQEDAENLYGLMVYDDELVLSIVNKQRPNQTEFHYLELPESASNYYSYFSIGEFGNRLVYINEYAEDDHFKLVAHFIDIETKTIGPEIVLHDKEYEKERTRGYYDLYWSEDGQHLVVSSFTYYKKRKKSDHALLLFDSDFSKVAERTLSGGNKYSRLGSILEVDNDGNLYAYIPRNDSLVIFHADQNYQDTYIKLSGDPRDKNGVFSNSKISIVNPNKILISSQFHSEEPDSPSKRTGFRVHADLPIAGLRIASVDPKSNSVLKNTKIHLYDEALREGFNKAVYHYSTLGQFMGSEVPSQDNSVFGTRVFHDSLGNSYLLIQQRIHILVPPASAGVHEQYGFYDLNIIALNQQEEILWTHRINRTREYIPHKDDAYGQRSFPQTTALRNILNQDSESFDCYAFLDDDQLVLIYNDLPENMANMNPESRIKKVDGHKKHIPVIQKINLENGERVGSIEKRMTLPKMILKPFQIYYSKMDNRFYYTTGNGKQIQISTFSMP